MPLKPRHSFGLGVLGLGLLLGTSAAGAGTVYTGVVTNPPLDRWMYPFGPTGPRPTASTFTTIGSTIEGFDDRDAQYLLGFDTGATVPSGRPTWAYNISSVTLTVRVLVEDGTPGWVFDATPDAATSVLPPSDPSATVDADAGRPIELFACDYRGEQPQTGQPWSALNYTQSSPFATLDPIGFARGNRAVFPIDFGGVGGASRDVSNNVTGAVRFDPEALSVAQVFAPGGVAVSPGATVPTQSDVRFEVSLASPGVREYIARGLAMGRLNLIVSSLHPASDFGSGPVVYPVYGTRFNPFSVSPRLELTVIFCPADIADDQGTPLPGNPGVPNNGVTEGDYNAFFGGYFDALAYCDIADDQGTPLPGNPDVPNNGVTEGDYNCFFARYFDGCP
jgi:hypothetical protein